MAKDLAIVLNNGSLNSAVVTALAAQKYRPIMVYAEVNPAEVRNRGAYDQQVAHFKPYREHTLSMGYLTMLQSPGDAQAQMADPRQTGLLAPQLLRLLPLIGAAAPLAAHYQAAAIYMGVRVGPAADDLAQATEYVQILNELLQLPCRQPELELVTPILELEAWQVIEVAHHVNAPLDRTWSCVEQTLDPCGVCRGCRQRQAAFQQAVKADPLAPVAKAK